MDKQQLTVLIVAVAAVIAIAYLALPRDTWPNSLGDAVTLTPTTSTPVQGDTVRVDITVSDVKDLYGAQLDVFYDPAELALVDIQEGTLLSQGVAGSTIGPSLTPPLLSPGSIKNLVVFRVGPASGVSTSGTLVSLTFQTLTPGTADITFGNILFSGSKGNPLNTGTVTPTTIHVAAPPDTTPPTIRITSPASGATVKETVTVTADATDTSGTVSVRFFVDGQLLGTDTTTPFSITWDTRSTTNAQHSIRAEALDGAGNLASTQTSLLVKNTVQSPGATLNPPTNLAVGRTSASTITLMWNAASDTRYGIAKYVLYRNGNQVGTTTLTGFTDSGLAATTTYKYEVSAVNGAGTESTKSNSVSGTTKRAHK